MVRVRKQPIAAYNEHNFALGDGDRVFERRDGGYVFYDLRESRGRNKRDAGDLTPVIVKKHGRVRLACRVGDVWFWRLNGEVV